MMDLLRYILGTVRVLKVLSNRCLEKTIVDLLMLGYQLLKHRFEINNELVNFKMYEYE